MIAVLFSKFSVSHPPPHHYQTTSTSLSHLHEQPFILFSNIADDSPTLLIVVERSISGLTTTRSRRELRISCIHLVQNCLVLRSGTLIYWRQVIEIPAITSTSRRYIQIRSRVRQACDELRFQARVHDIQLERGVGSYP